jgi:hypothetical protein
MSLSSRVEFRRALPSNKALQTETSRHAFCIRNSRASLPLPLSLVVIRRLVRSPA